MDSRMEEKSAEISTASAMMRLVLIDRLSMREVDWRCAISESYERVDSRLHHWKVDREFSGSVSWLIKDLRWWRHSTYFHNTIKTSSKLWLQFLCVAGILITHETLPQRMQGIVTSSTAAKVKINCELKTQKKEAKKKNVYDNRNRLPLSAQLESTKK